MSRERESEAREVLALHGMTHGFNLPVLPGYVVAVDPDAVIAAMLDLADRERHRAAEIAENAVTYVVGEQRDLCDRIASQIRSMTIDIKGEKG